MVVVTQLCVLLACGLSVAGQNLFNLFPGLQLPNMRPPPPRSPALPPVQRHGRPANEKLHACCRKLPDADLECKRRFCDFSALSSNNVLGFLGTCASRGPTVGQMWDCASSRADHRPCCTALGVQGQCMAYCETTKGVPTDYVKYLVCLGDFNKIRDCFQRHLEEHPNLKGDL